MDSLLPACKTVGNTSSTPMFTETPAQEALSALFSNIFQPVVEISCYYDIHVLIFRASNWICHLQSPEDFFTQCVHVKIA